MLLQKLTEIKYEIKNRKDIIHDSFVAAAKLVEVEKLNPETSNGFTEPFTTLVVSDHSDAKSHSPEALKQQFFSVMKEGSEMANTVVFAHLTQTVTSFQNIT